MSKENKRKHLPPPAFPRVIRERVREISVGSAAVDDLSTSSDDSIPVHGLSVRKGAPHKPGLGNDTDVSELVDALSKLADTLKREGEAGLVAQSGMTRLDSMLRSYCQGYLTGRRMGDE